MRNYKTVRLHPCDVDRDCPGVGPSHREHDFDGAIEKIETEDSEVEAELAKMYDVLTALQGSATVTSGKDRSKPGKARRKNRRR